MCFFWGGGGGGENFIFRRRGLIFLNYGYPDEKIGFTTSNLPWYLFSLTFFQEMLFRRTCKLVEFENATKALEKAKPKNQEAVSLVNPDLCECKASMLHV